MSGAPPLPAHAETLRDGRPLPPADAAVPALPSLLDREAMTAVLGRSVRAGAHVDRVHVLTVDYRPGSGATVAYDVTVAGRHRVAVAATGPAGGAEAARTPARLAIARALGADAAVARPLTYDAGLGAVVHWYPLDLAMPVLAKPRAELLRLVSRAGVAAEQAAGPSETLLYRPGQRAVVRLGGVVLKAYATDAAFRAGVEGLRIAGGLRLPRGPRLHAAFADLRLTVQPALDGDPVPRVRAGAVAPVAGAMLRVLHQSAVRGLAVATPQGLLEDVAESAALVGAVAPRLARRARDLLARLEEHAPAGDELVPSHGDFNVSQFLEIDGALAVLDFDEACLAPPALDAAAYAANLVGGRAGDLERARQALDGLLLGYGARPAHLDWYLAALLLRRARNPFRLYKRRWPKRIEQMLAAGEEVLRP
ncbi:MAG TPA: phosphotransferase [Solirubrobacteraceae bacterium]|nr:phosphotransferase [Solirubrobacteraceae bacterium]